MHNHNQATFKYLLKTILHNEISQIVVNLNTPMTLPPKKYLTINEVSQITGVGTYTIRQLTFARSMPHRKVRSRIIFDETEIIETISNYKNLGWTDPDKTWDVSAVQSQMYLLI